MSEKETDYTALVRDLRRCSMKEPCEGCAYRPTVRNGTEFCVLNLLSAAADAVENLTGVYG